MVTLDNAHRLNYIPPTRERSIPEWLSLLGLWRSKILPKMYYHLIFKRSGKEQTYLHAL